MFFLFCYSEKIESEIDKSINIGKEYMALIGAAFYSLDLLFDKKSFFLFALFVFFVNVKLENVWYVC